MFQVASRFQIHRKGLVYLRKRLLAVIPAIALLLLLSACGGSKEPPDLTGEWKQNNSNAEDTYQAAYIRSDSIEIYWVIGDGSGEEAIALYWAGTFVPPSDTKEPYIWESENDTSRTKNAILASDDATKTFTYQSGEISYQVTFQGVTTTVKLEKAEWGYGTKGNANPFTDLFLQGGSSSQSNSSSENQTASPTPVEVEQAPAVTEFEPPAQSEPDTTASDNAPDEWWADQPAVEPELPVQDSPQTFVGSGAVGDYYVEIKDAALCYDYEGNPAIVINYAWTNNGQDTTSAMISMMEKAFQDGVQLDSALIFDSSVYDASMSMKDVRPGNTVNVQCAFTLTSMSVVEFELSEAFTWDDGNVVTMNFNPAELSFG